MMQDINNIIRYLIKENIHQANNEYDLTSDCVFEIGEYVGANIQFNFEKYKQQIKPFVKQWNQLYRIWPVSANRDFDELITKIKTRPYFSATRSLNAIHMMADEYEPMRGKPDHIVISFSGLGFDPYLLLSQGLNTLSFSKDDTKWLQEVLSFNRQQAEVIVTKLFEPIERLYI
jgi:hypothetical protein